MAAAFCVGKRGNMMAKQKSGCLGLSTLATRVICVAVALLLSGLITLLSAPVHTIAGAEALGRGYYPGAAGADASASGAASAASASSAALAASASSASVPADATASATASAFVAQAASVAAFSAFDPAAELPAADNDNEDYEVDPNEYDDEIDDECDIEFDDECDIEFDDEPDNGHDAGATNTGPSHRFFLDDQELFFEYEVIEYGNRVYYPLRSFLEAIGAEVTWDQGRSAVQVVRNRTEVLFFLGSGAFTINGAARNMQGASVIIDHAINRTFIPVRYGAETLGFAVEWLPDAETDDVVIIIRNTPAS